MIVWSKFTLAIRSWSLAFAAEWRTLSQTNKVVLIAAFIGTFGALAQPVVTRLVNGSSDTQGFEGVELVSTVALDEAAVGGPPDSVNQVLDIKLRNTGEEVQVLKEVSLTVSVAVPILCGTTHASALPVSGTYDLVLPATPPPEGHRETVQVSQTIPPGEADRIQLRVSLADDGEAPDLLYVVKVQLTFNAGTEDVLTSPDFPVLPFVRDIDLHFARRCPQASAIRDFLEESPNLSGRGQQLLEALQ
ncbi:hypothetical protein ACI799_08010 [Blastococcus sp. SYSU DS0753]